MRLAGNPALARRLARVRQELEEGSDAWGRRFAALEPAAERFAWEKQLGAIRRGTRAALSTEPLARIERLRQAMEQVMAILLVPEGADHSPEERSHLVYDPFPARLTVRLPGRPLEAPEGFTVDPDGKTLVATGPGLWHALQSLEGQWIAPDPVLFYVQRDGREQKEPLDLDALLASPRRAEPAPSADEVREALEVRLRPVPLYRVTFAVQPDAEPTAAEIGWSF